MKSLAELCTSVDYGYTASASEDPSVGPKFLRITDIVPDLIDWSTVPHCEIEAGKRGKFLLHEGDIVVARTGATVGYAKQIWARPEGATFASYLVRFRPDPGKVDPFYLGQIVESTLFKRWVNSVAGGAAQPNASAKLLGTFEVPLLARDQQRKVGLMLRAIGEAIENHQRRIETLEQMARALYREWFVQLRFPGHDGPKSVDSELGLLPAGWQALPLADLVTTQYGYTESADDEAVGPRYLRGMDMNKTSFIDWSKVPYCPISDGDRDKFSINVGDVFVIRMADPGKVSICERDVDAVFASYLVRLRPRDGRMLPYYLYFTLSDDRYQGWVTGASTGATRKSVSAKVMTEPAVLLPPLSVQEAFVDIVRPIRQLLTNLVEKKAELASARDLLLPRFLSGDLDVAALDMDLEPVA